MIADATGLVPEQYLEAQQEERVAPVPTQPTRLSRNPFKKMKEKRRMQKQLEQKDEVADVRDPKITFKDHLWLFGKFGSFNLLLLFLGTVGSVGAGLISIFIQFIVGDLLNVLSSSTASKEDIRAGVNTIGWKLTIVAASAFVANFMFQFFFNWANERIGQKLRELYFNSLTAQEMAFFDIKKVGALTAVLSDDVAKIQEAYTNKIATLIQNAATVIGGFVMAVVSAYRMSLVIASTIPLLFFFMMFLGIAIRYFTAKTNEANAKGMAMASEIISSIKTVRSMTGEIKEQNKYKKQMAIVNRYGFFKALSFGIAFIIVTFTIWGTVALGLWYGGMNVVDGITSLGDYFKVCGLMIMTVLSLIQIFAFFPDFAKSILSEAILLKVIKRKPEIPFKGGKAIDNLKGNISFRNVDFIYPARPNTTVLKNFSLDIQQGQSVALVGPSGSGKSTIVGLVEKFYNPNAGEIFIDGVNILELDPMVLHRKIGIVTQEPVLFAASIRDNIAYAVGSENVTLEEIISAAKLANCHNFIMDLPEQYDTLLGEKGVSMSGGQKQRIAIARALIQNPSVLLLDEATSALDTESEALVQDALDNLMKGRTTICIAHRLSTIKNSDVICVLVKGKLVEKGKHDELLDISQGVYRKLAERQMATAPKREDAEETLDLMEDNNELQ